MSHRAATRPVSTAQGVVADHRHLRKHLDWLEQAADDEAIRFLLDELADFLPGHFAAEEGTDGLFASVVLKAPRLAPLARRLREQHRDILAMIEHLRRRVPSDLKPAEGSLKRRVQEVVDVLREHEADETMMLAEAVMGEHEEGG